MKSIACIFNHSPYGKSFGREGLDAILALSSINKNISIFFLGDGVFHLIKQQNPTKIFIHNYTKIFKIISLFEIKKYFVSLESIIQRGIKKNEIFLNNKIVNNSIILHTKQISKLLNDYNFIITF